jgi:NADH-quinone oxidoreductase subunit G
MPKITIDGKEIEVEQGLTIIQACQIAGTEIPHFCYHERLAIAGNCRMCLVEIEKSPKPVASCAMPISEGMIVHTNTPKIQKARKGVMEFLLINHPLDCPICDQGGECDLQDQAFKYGSGKSRYNADKRAVVDKDMGPLVKTHMTRCIHCMRCVRFATDIAGVEEIGSLGRGEHMEVTTYLDKALTSELSANIIDLCPVGALTAKPSAFKARSWELKHTQSVDVLDALGSNIRVDTRGLEVIRILPINNDDINEEWISDKTRFACDGLKNQRLDKPYIRKNGKLVVATWKEAIAKISSEILKYEPSEISAVAGTLCDLESMFLLKELMNKLGSTNTDFNQFDYKFDYSKRGNYLFNTSIAGIDHADACLLIGANPRKIAPVLNARIGQKVRKNRMVVARIGEPDDQTYKLTELGNDISSLNTNFLAEFSHPMVIVGDGIYTRKDGHALMTKIYAMCNKYNVIRDDWNGLNILHNHASTVGAIDIGFTPGKKGLSAKEMAKKSKFIYLLGADELAIPEGAFVVYQGHHGDRGAHRADVILPATAYTEKDGIYINFEGRAQFGRQAVQPLGEAKDDREIILSIMQALKIDTEYVNLAIIRKHLAATVEAVANINAIVKSYVAFTSVDEKISDKPIETVKCNFYMTDSISRASITMAKCQNASTD